MRYALCMLLCGFLVGLSALPARTQESAKQSWGEQALVAYANGDKARARILAQRALAEGKAQATLVIST